jgi:hypothetical protein
MTMTFRAYAEAKARWYAREHNAQAVALVPIKPPKVGYWNIRIACGDCDNAEQKNPSALRSCRYAGDVSRHLSSLSPSCPFRIEFDGAKP